MLTRFSHKYVIPSSVVAVCPWSQYGNVSKAGACVQAERKSTDFDRELDAGNAAVRIDFMTASVQ
jgi:hypothetical protein